MLLWEKSILTSSLCLLTLGQEQRAGELRGGAIGRAIFPLKASTEHLVATPYPLAEPLGDNSQPSLR